jgi:hypothetical protein
MRVQARIREQLMRFKLNDNEEVIQNMMSSYVTTTPRFVDFATEAAAAYPHSPYVCLSDTPIP